MAWSASARRPHPRLHRLADQQCLDHGIEKERRQTPPGGSGRNFETSHSESLLDHRDHGDDAWPPSTPYAGACGATTQTETDVSSPWISCDKSNEPCPAWRGTTTCAARRSEQIPKQTEFNRRTFSDLFFCGIREGGAHGEAVGCVVNMEVFHFDDDSICGTREATESVPSDLDDMSPAETKVRVHLGKIAARLSPCSIKAPARWTINHDVCLSLVAVAIRPPDGGETHGPTRPPSNPWPPQSFFSAFASVGVSSAATLARRLRTASSSAKKMQTSIMECLEGIIQVPIPDGAWFPPRSKTLTSSERLCTAFTSCFTHGRHMAPCVARSSTVSAITQLWGPCVVDRIHRHKQLAHEAAQQPGRHAQRESRTPPTPSRNWRIPQRASIDTPTSDPSPGGLDFRSLGSHRRLEASLGHQEPGLCQRPQPPDGSTTVPASLLRMSTPVRACDSARTVPHPERYQTRLGSGHLFVV